VAHQTKGKGTTALHVGDRVRFRLGLRDVEGEVVEDRGSIGARGRKIVRVIVIPPTQEPPDPDESFELPADDLLVLG